MQENIIDLTSRDIIDSFKEKYKEENKPPIKATLNLPRVNILAEGSDSPCWNKNMIISFLFFHGIFVSFF